MQYIPKDLEQTVRSWVEDFQEASALLESISKHGHLRFKSAKDARAEKKSTTARKTSAKKAIRKKRVMQKKQPRKKISSTRRKRSS
jgi:topoisomerase IA-like protein